MCGVLNPVDTHDLDIIYSLRYELIVKIIQDAEPALTDLSSRIAKIVG